MIITIGGGSRPQTNFVWRNILEKINKPSVLYVPYARKQADYSVCLEYIYQEIGMDNFSQLMMLQYKNEYIEDEFDEFNTMYIGGGSVPDLLDFIYTTKFDRVLRHWNNMDKVVIGSSAGAIIMGKDAKMYRDFPQGILFRKGLDFCGGISFACHYKEKGVYKSLSALDVQKKILNYINNNISTVIALPEDSAIIWNKNGRIEQVINSAYEFKKALVEG